MPAQAPQRYPCGMGMGRASSADEHQHSVGQLLDAEGASLMRLIEELVHHFQRADQTTLRQALDSGDFLAVCAAMDLSPESLKLLLKAGQHDVLELAQQHPEFQKVLLDRARK